jgi:DsbC/DsbD-like thiol-disulfide interchange protein
MKAALQVDLAPGWKTYWRDPGDAGVPPQVTFPAASGIETAEIGFPVPARFEDATSKWAGYEWPVSLALTLKVAKDTKPTELEADVFLGICQTICIPVQAALTLDPSVRADDMFDRSLVNAAFDSVPRPASESFGVTSRRIDGKYLTVDVKAPANGDLTLFLAGDGDYQFGEPKRLDGTASFKTKLVSTPDKAAAPATINYTLASPDGAVQGTFTLP